MAAADPERELVWRIVPRALPAIPLAFLLGLAAGGANAGWSAAIGVTVVLANFAAHGLSLARAARISPTVLFAVGLGGFFVRLSGILMVMLALDRLKFFSPGAFAAALVPATVALLVFEIRLLSGRFSADLWSFPAGPTGDHG